MNKKMVVTVVIITIVFTSLSCLLGKQHHDLKLYENGFNNIGTYASGDDDGHNQRYVVFSDDTLFYTYRQFTSKKEGVYEKTENPNLYRVILPEEDVMIYAMIAKDSLSLIEDNKVTNFQKISDGRININVIEDE